MNRQPLWACPSCGRAFVNKNQWHSCSGYTVADFLHGKSEYAVALYHSFVDRLRSIGDFTVSPAKTRVAFQTRIRFAAINRIGRDFLNGHLLLKKEYDSEKFYRVEAHLDPNLVVHHFKILSAEEIDEEFEAFMREAYSIGLQQHLD